MSPTTRDDPQSLERFRPYLHLLARLRLQGEKQKRIDPTDMVQQTLFAANQQRERFRGSTSAEMALWLRRLLAQNLGQAFRTLHRENEDDTILDTSTRAAPEFNKTPSGRSAPESASRREEPQARDDSIILAEALVDLPEPEREALVLQYWHDLTLVEIAARLERTPLTVAGLLKRGLSRLRGKLPASAQVADVRRGPEKPG
jgi:RNA polymerase sigma-70 factor (ECF subfamily)